MSHTIEPDPASPQNVTKLVKLATCISDRSAEILAGFGAAIVSIAPYLPIPDQAITLLVVIGATFMLCSIYLEHKKSEEISKLREREGDLTRRELRARHALNSSIGHLALELSREVDLYNTDVRLTVYAHDAEKRQFIPLARVSDNPEYKKLNRESYPDNQGYLSETWKNRTQSVWNRKATRARKDALESNFTGDEYDALPHKIVCSYGLRLDNGDQPVGVIFWESAKRNGFEVGELAERLGNNSTVEVLGSVLAASKELAPELSGLALEQH